MPKPAHPDALSQPHDRLFKWTFSQRKHAAGLLRAILPKDVVAAVNWSSLKLESGTYVSKALRQRHSDLVFSVKVRDKTVYVYVLVEQQRALDKLMVARMGGYLMRFWERFMADNPLAEELPPLYPVLIYHGPSGWTAATSFHDVIALDEVLRPALGPHLPSFAMPVLALNDHDAEALHHGTKAALTSLGLVVLWCLSVAGDGQRFLREMARYGAAFREVLRAPNGVAALEVLLRYLANTQAGLGLKTITKTLELTAGPEAREVIVTTLDEIENRGRKAGLSEGRKAGLSEGFAQGRAQMLLELLAIRFGKVPAEARTRIKAADEQTLTLWAARVLTAETLEGVLDARKAAEKPRRRAR